MMQIQAQMNTPAHKSKRIKQKALELGFLECGIARAELLEKDAARLKVWLYNGYNAEMGYMKEHFEKRCDPRILVEGAQSVIVVLQNYNTQAKQKDPHAPKISRYAYGKDYHKIIRKKMKRILAWIGDEMGPVSGRVFVDSAPVMERAWGRLAGLGWIGKHSLLLNRKHGSWFFLGAIICDLELEPDKPVREYCGDCTRCIDACPTGAILDGRTVDASRCLSYLTIEYKDERLPEKHREEVNGWVFGCDICQDACPWNNNAHSHDENWLDPLPGLLEMTRGDWMNLDEKKYHTIFEGSAIKRAGFSGLRRNIDFLR
jgi:epoxyqueuosine reductase